MMENTSYETQNAVGFFSLRHVCVTVNVVFLFYMGQLLHFSVHLLPEIGPETLEQV
jgi:hypothetical protein